MDNRLVHMISLRVPLGLFDAIDRVCKGERVSKNRFILSVLEDALQRAEHPDERMYVVAIPNGPRPPVHLESGRIHINRFAASRRCEQIQTSYPDAYVLEVTEADLDEEQLQWLAMRKGT